VKLQQFRNFLSSSCRIFQDEEGALAPDTRALWEEWVVGRSLCAFRSVDVGNIENRARKEVLDMMVAQWVPFQKPEYHVETSGALARIWVWDGERRRLESEKLKAIPDRIIPESLVRPRAETAVADQPDEAAVDLVACLSGFEGRAWLGDQIVASRWWPHIPSLLSWNRFLLTVDQAPVAAVPEAIEQSERKTESPSRQELLKTLLGSELRQLALMFALFAIFSSYQLGVFAYAALSSAGLEESIVRLNNEVGSVLSARESAREYEAAVADLARLHTTPLQIEFISRVQALIASAGESNEEVSLAGWNYEDSGAVVITVHSESMTASKLLSLFETQPWLQDLRVVDDLAPNRLNVEGKLTPGWQFAGATESGAL